MFISPHARALRCPVLRVRARRCSYCCCSHYCATALLCITVGFHLLITTIDTAVALCTTTYPTAFTTDGTALCEKAYWPCVRATDLVPGKTNEYTDLSDKVVVSQAVK
jgi:hypothetical protein